MNEIQRLRHRTRRWTARRNAWANKLTHAAFMRPASVVLRNGGGRSATSTVLVSALSLRLS